jgi:2-polyprenyl-6-methoxyphenol hydroxylase-like FAD-dependent oxidoreductase
MSPVGGVGINLAIQDAVAAANILARPLREKRITPAILQLVQQRREWPTRMTQRLQVTVQNRIFSRVLRTTDNRPPPWYVRALLNFPLTRHIPARIIGMGFRPEHVDVGMFE